MARNLRLPIIDIICVGRMIQVWVLWARGSIHEPMSQRGGAHSSTYRHNRLVPHVRHDTQSSESKAFNKEKTRIRGGENRGMNRLMDGWGRVEEKAYCALRLT